jgi:hypothetical protein
VTISKLTFSGPANYCSFHPRKPKLAVASGNEVCVFSGTTSEAGSSNWHKDTFRSNKSWMFGDWDAWKLEWNVSKFNNFYGKKFKLKRCSPTV